MKTVTLKTAKRGIDSPPPSLGVLRAIANLPDDIEEGELVNVVVSDGRVLGAGGFQQAALP